MFYLCLQTFEYIELHGRDFRSFVTQYPTCTDGYLMKVELKTLIDSIREFLPLSQSLMTDNDPLRFEKISPGCVKFMETQSGDRISFKVSLLKPT